ARLAPQRPGLREVRGFASRLCADAAHAVARGRVPGSGTKGRAHRTDPVQVAEALAPRFAARAAAHDADASFPADDVADLRESGLLGLLVPPHLGGLGAGFADYVRVAEALARGSGSTALVFNMHASVTGALAGVPD